MLFEWDKGLPPTNIDSVYGHMDKAALNELRRKQASARIKNLFNPKVRRQEAYHLDQLQETYKSMANERGYLLIRRLLDRQFISLEQGAHIQILRNRESYSTVDAFITLGEEFERDEPRANCAIYVHNLNTGIHSLFYIRTGGTQELSEDYVKEVGIIDTGTGQTFTPEDYS